jgi:hypothetical protein
MHRSTLALLPLICLSTFAVPAAMADSAKPKAPADSAKPAEQAEPAAPSEPTIPATPTVLSRLLTTPDHAEHLKNAYELSERYGDWTAAAPLAAQLAILEPSKAGHWLEELAKIQFVTRRYANCLRIITDLNAQYGGSQKLSLQEMKALSHEGLGQKVEARDAWKVVWDMSGGAAYATRLAGVHFELQELDQAEAIIALGLVAADAKTSTVPLPKTREEMQAVPAAAALHNLKALILMKRDLANKEAAIAQLKSALALAPEFELAKRNLAGLNTPPAKDAKDVKDTRDAK